MGRIKIDYWKAEDNNKEKYEKYVSEIKKNDDEYNKKIDQRKQNYYNGENKEVINIYKRIMTELQPPVDSIKFINLSYDNKKAQLNLEFLNPLTELERTKEVKYIKSKWTVKNVEYTKALLEKNGFEKVVVTQASGDYGADIIAYKDSIKYAIQCKKYSSKVGVRAVQEVIASKSMYKCHVGVVLTNNYFTPNA